MMIAAKLYRFSIDRLNGRFISGWSFNRFAKSRPVSIVAAADEKVLGRFTNNGYRADLVEKNLHPSGVCGFDFSFPPEFDPRAFGKFHLYFDSFKTPVATVDCSEIEILQPQLSTPICFMHIPKTAGTSFNSFARSCFAGDRFFTHIERLEESELRGGVDRALYLAGHLPLYQLGRLVDLSSYDLISIIREPFAHLHSHLNYVRGVRPGSRLEIHYGFHHNETVKALSDELNQVDFSDLEEVNGFVGGLHDYQNDFFDNIQTRYFLDYRPERVEKQDLQRACENISNFSSVGLTEAYNHFKKQFCHSIGVAPGEQKLQSNKSEYYQLLDLADPKVKAALQPLVNYDLKLYEFVSARFWQNKI
ncbi:MAG: hypothetical protein ACR2PB_10960 [Desulfocapsaceae bacterium]